MSAQRKAPAPEGPLHLVLGTDEFLADRAASNVIAGARAQVAGEGLEELVVSWRASSEITPVEISELLAPSLFGEPRAVVITGAAELGKEGVALVEDAAADLPENVWLVVLHSGGGRAKALAPALRKLGAVEHDAQPIKRPAAILAFVRSEFSSHSARVSQDVCEALVEAIGTDLRELAAAAAQLVSDTDGAIDVAAVHRYYQGVVGVTGFTVADYAVTGRVDEAIEALEWAMHSGTPHVLLADALADGVWSIAMVRTHPDAQQKEIYALGLQPWKFDKIKRSQARYWGGGNLASALQVVARLNGEVKGGTRDTAFALERAVRQVGALAAA
ncbi:DNA polymerase III subunit delta [Dietzia sp.]|uniref:DNA polymerase III subunit delta n=1 Tax=Dietzia sp. TaxID=1871616 RepID=UPI002FDAA6B2